MAEKILIFDNLKPICFGQRRTIITKEDNVFTLQSFTISNLSEIGLYKTVGPKQITQQEVDQIRLGELRDDLGILSSPWL